MVGVEVKDIHSEDICHYRLQPKQNKDIHSEDTCHYRLQPKPAPIVDLVLS